MRVAFTEYKNSSFATIVSFFGTMLSIGGACVIESGITDKSVDTASYIFGGIFSITLGVILAILAPKIAEVETSKEWIPI